MIRAMPIAILAAFLVLIAPGCQTVERAQSTLRLTELSGQARQAQIDGDFERARDLWLQYVQRRPHSHSAEYNLGLVETELGLYDDAVSHLSIAHDLRPGNDDYIAALAQAYLRVGETDRMMTLLRRAEHERNDLDDILRTAEFARRAGLMDDAQEALRRAVALGGMDSPRPHLAVADFAHAIGNRDLEIAALRRALWFGPDSRAYHARLTALGVTPGPSLAMHPQRGYDF